MPSPRWLAALTVPVMVGAALITNAATAAADPNDAISLSCAVPASRGRRATRRA